MPDRLLEASFLRCKCLGVKGFGVQSPKVHGRWDLHRCCVGQGGRTHEFEGCRDIGLTVQIADTPLNPKLQIVDSLELQIVASLKLRNPDWNQEA